MKKYLYNYYRGIPNTKKPQKPQIERDRDRLLKYRIIDPTTGCWLWTKHVNNQGYGYIKVTKGKHKQVGVRVHRFSFQLFNNIELTQDDCLHHLCRNRKCFNPAHLEITTHDLNMLEKKSDWLEFEKEHEDLLNQYRSIKFRIKKEYRDWHKEVTSSLSLLFE